MAVLLSLGVVWPALIVAVIPGAGLFDQDATAGRLMTAPSPFPVMVSSIMWRTRRTDLSVVNLRHEVEPPACAISEGLGVIC